MCFCRSTEQLLLQTASARLHWLFTNKCLLKSWSSFQSLKVVSESWVVVQQDSALNDRRPPNIEPNDTVGCCELVPTDELLVSEVLGEDAGTDGELSHHGVNKRLVLFLLWSVSELHVERLKDVVKCAGGIADETTN